MYNKPRRVVEEIVSNDFHVESRTGKWMTCKQVGHQKFHSKLHTKILLFIFIKTSLKSMTSTLLVLRK